jgi:hypothetical protein
MLTAITGDNSQSLATADASRLLLNCQHIFHVGTATQTRDDLDFVRRQITATQQQQLGFDFDGPIRFCRGLFRG